jgi:hypothetical protein
VRRYPRSRQHVHINIPPCKNFGSWKKGETTIRDRCRMHDPVQPNNPSHLHIFTSIILVTITSISDFYENNSHSEG